MPIKLPEPFPPLPSLPVIRDTWCSQEMTDSVIRFVEQRRPDLIAHVAREQNVARDGIYHKWINKALHYLINEAAEEIEIPSTRLGHLDLMFEFSRRIAKASSKPDLELIGKPIAGGPDKPLVPLIVPPRSRVDQVPDDIADKVARAVYDNRPELLYEMAEQFRRSINLTEIRGVLLGYLYNDLLPTLDVPVKYQLQLYGNIHFRISLMIGLPIPSHFEPRDS